ncbi:MAG: hypothetical protein JEZ07_12745 [Phycisphaerae bacterium]|nr:hypothetical protein [Phycisphaerae bacterium]
MNYDENDVLSSLLQKHFGLKDPDVQSDLDPELITDSQIQQVDKKLQEVLEPLKSWPDEPSDNLTRRTLDFIEARSAVTAGGNTKKVKVNDFETSTTSQLFWLLTNFRDLIAVAACVAVLFLVSKPTLNEAKQRAWQQECSWKLYQAGQGFESYSQDNNGYLFDNKVQSAFSPAIQDMRAKDYIQAGTLLCPAVSHDTTAMDSDFSFRLASDKSHLRWGNANQVLAADKNPIFQRFIINDLNELDLNNIPDLRKINSLNHKARGQNLLFNDGSVVYSETRNVGTAQDDIYTIQGTDKYRRDQMPVPKDVFISY